MFPSGSSNQTPFSFPMVATPSDQVAPSMSNVWKSMPLSRSAATSS